MNSFQFLTVKKIVCEPGSAQGLSSYCQELAIHRLMLITDPGIVKTGMTESIVKLIEQAGISVLVYSEVQADPPESLVLAAAKLAHDKDIDGVIGLGGGSSLDVAKLVAVLAISKQPLNELYGIDKVCGGRLPLILVPTTAGTGSEVTATSIVTTGAITKSGIIAPQLIPDITLLDAELTTGLPPLTTAATGIDAMVHAIEAYTSKHKKNSISDMLARQALRLISANIVEAVHNGSNLEARSNMLLGAMMAGQAFANSPVAAVHALAYPLGGHYHIPHGLSNSLVLPHVLRFNAEAAGDMYAELLPCISRCDYIENNMVVSCDIFIEEIEGIISKVGLPKTLREQNIPKADLPMLANDAILQQRLLINNPKDVSQKDALSIYKAAY